ncbi:MAG: hypothetical protein KDB48_00470 [Solirubrobacterales bacterium]|nr:hypothetical protein [Solirubrobacterales bacterium]HMT04135.1 hypothetical protein [Solirubrobacterales bacterium]
MKLAAFGLIVGLVGLLLGIDGLILSGGIWIATGLLIRILVQPGERSHSIDASVEAEIGRIETGEGRNLRLGVPGMFLLLISGLGSIAIGILSIGFPDDYEYLRWLPFAVGVAITVIGLTSIPVELGLIKAGSGAADAAPTEGKDSPAVLRSQTVRKE